MGVGEGVMWWAECAVELFRRSARTAGWAGHGEGEPKRVGWWVGVFVEASG